MIQANNNYHSIRTPNNTCRIKYFHAAYTIIKTYMEFLKMNITQHCETFTMRAWFEIEEKCARHFLSFYLIVWWINYRFCTQNSISSIRCLSYQSIISFLRTFCNEEKDKNTCKIYDGLFVICNTIVMSTIKYIIGTFAIYFYLYFLLRSNYFNDIPFTYNIW